MGTTICVNFNLSSLSGSFSQIDLQASDNITLNSAWIAGRRRSPAALNLSAGNNSP